MLSALTLAFTLGAAVCVAFTAVRRVEWRGGMLVLACLFLASAANECEGLWRRFLPGWFHEPELLPILVFLAAAVLIAALNRGTTYLGLAAVLRNRRLPLLVWGLLLVSVVPNIAQSRRFWALLVPAAENTHNVREAAQGAVALFGNLLLLNWAALFLRDKYRRFARRVSPLNRLVFENALTEVGRGTRRVAYKVGDTGYCAKFYRPREDCAAAKGSVRRDIRWRRFNKHRNASSEEVYVYNLLRHTLPRAIRARLPPVCARVYHPDWGWGVIETYYANPDGTAIIPYEYEIRRQASAAVKREIYRQARDLLLALIRASALFHEPGNFHVLLDGRGGVELKLIDFEPESKTAIPLEMVWPWFRRRKLRRKARRYLRHIREKYGVDVPVETEIG